MQLLNNIFIGIVNGIFSSGAGQILLFYLLYIKKMDSKEARNICLQTMPIISIPSCLIYLSKIEIDKIKIYILVGISIVFGIAGNIFMKKLNSNILNLISGIILTILTIINLWRILWYML